MDKVASDMSSFFNRTLQKTEEAFKITEKTTPDPQVEHLTAECNKRKKWADNLVSILQSVIQPSIAARIGDMVLKNLDTKKERLNDAEQLGDEMIRIGTELGDDAYGTLLKRCGEAEQAIGKAISDFRRRVEDGYLGALRSYSHNCAKSALSSEFNIALMSFLSTLPRNTC
ncbi:unnamed protein product [Dicrocoelium dendriticum]|nr:unnamed protein product [Dicrocoelium dendriticum]